MGNKENFRKFLNDWMTANWRGNQTAFATFLGITRQNLSNILNGHKGASESTRIAICNKIGVDYRLILETGDPNDPDNKDKILPCVRPIDSRLEAMKANLLDIYESGNLSLISAIEMNLVSLKAMIRMEGRARKREPLSSLEESESLLNPPTPQKKRG
jgi:hypothetical protein